MKKMNLISDYYTVVITIMLIFIAGCSGESADISNSSEVVSQEESIQAKGVQGTVDFSDDIDTGGKNTIAIGNTPPKIVSLKLIPRLVYPGTEIRVEVDSSDVDDDVVSYSYVWRKNKEIVEGENSDTLDTSAFVKGDFITVTIRPSDGKKKGLSKRSVPIIIANRPPEITSFPPSDFTDGKFEYQVESSDEDDDELSYSLEGGPEGMVIDSETGKVEWIVPEDAKGSFQVRIIVKDGNDSAYQTFSLDLQ